MSNYTQTREGQIRQAMKEIPSIVKNRYVESKGDFFWWFGKWPLMIDVINSMDYGHYYRSNIYDALWELMDRRIIIVKDTKKGPRLKWKKKALGWPSNMHVNGRGTPYKDTSDFFRSPIIQAQIKAAAENERSRANH